MEQQGSKFLQISPVEFINSPKYGLMINHHIREGRVYYLCYMTNAKHTTQKTWTTITYLIGIPTSSNKQNKKSVAETAEKETKKTAK